MVVGVVVDVVVVDVVVVDVEVVDVEVEVDAAEVGDPLGVVVVSTCGRVEGGIVVVRSAVEPCGVLENPPLKA